MDALGNGVANFNGTDYLFTTSAGYHNGAFSVSYRENLQLGADATRGRPDCARRRSPSFEPATLSLLGLGGLGLLAAPRRA